MHVMYKEQVYTKSLLLLLQGSLWASLLSTSTTINQSLWRSSGTIMYNAGLNREHTFSITNIYSHFFSWSSCVNVNCS